MEYNIMRRKRRRQNMSDTQNTEKVKVEEIKAEEPKVEEMVEETKIETVEVEPKAEEPKVEPKAEPKVKESKAEEPKVEPKAEEPKVEVSEPVDNNDDIFITEKDKFTIPMTYYMNEKREPFIEGFSEGYDPDGKEIHSFEMYFKYPSQKDAEYIMATKPIQNIEDATVIDFIELENVRIITLMRGWSMKRPLTDLAQIHPTIVKAMRTKVSEEIGGNGMF